MFNCYVVLRDSEVLGIFPSESRAMLFMQAYREFYSLKSLLNFSIEGRYMPGVTF